VNALTRVRRRWPARSGRRANGGSSDAETERSVRTFWWVAGVVGTVMVGVVLWQLLLPRPFYTGTNSVGVRSIVGTVDRGRTLCVPDLSIPSGTGRVRFAVFASQSSVRVRVRLVAGSRTSVATAVGQPGPGGRINLDAPAPSPPGQHGTVTGSACLTALDGPVQIGGMAGLQADQAAARLDGKPFENRVSVWFLPPSGTRRSLLASAGDILSRAALFRPGIVGPWTYVVLLLVVLPVTSLVALKLMAAALRERRWRIRPALVIFLIAFVNAGSWALITPAFNTPDEPDHFAYAQYLAETGHQPAQSGTLAPFSTDEVEALNGVRTYSQVSIGDARPPWTKGDERAWKQFEAGAPHRRDDGGGPTGSAAPHSPLYYALLVPAYDLVGSSSPFSQLTLMRFVSGLLGAIVAVCAFAIVRELLPRQRFAAVGAGLLVAFQPMFTFMAGGVNNDNGVNAAAALSLYLVIRGLRRGLTWRLGLALGAVMAITPLMKGTGYEIYPIVALGVLGMLWRRHAPRDLREWAIVVAAFAAVRVAWAAVGPLFHHGGVTTGTAISASNSVSAALHSPKRYLEYLWQVFLPRLSFMPDMWVQRWPFYDIYLHNGWGAFGWYAIVFPSWVYAVIVATMAIVGILGLATLVRERVIVRRLSWELIVIVLTPVCVLAAVEAAYFTPVARAVPAEQGRYLFPAVAALAVMAAGGTFGLGRRWHVPLLTALVVAVVGLSFASRLLSLAAFYT
jgi:4-amino-4-deoxy-L-arabinose transferase-like glycosyltransferase